jgi:hypothetical protein
MARRRPDTPMSMAKRKSREVQNALHACQMFVFPVERQRPGLVPVWESHFEGTYARRLLIGDWELHGRWRYWSDPVSGEPLLQESSVGITVAEHGQPDLPSPVCIARYDVELYGAKRGRHTNIFQPVIKDAVHWIYPDAARLEDWSLELLLAFVVRELPAELLAAGWPPAP